MSQQHGQFVWCDLMTTDATSAAAFYSAVIGWRAQDAGMSDRDYTILHAGEIPMGGIVELPTSARDAGARPTWSGYIGCDDVDASAIRIKGAGGAIHRAAEDIPGVGRFAIVTDPQGAGFTLFRSLHGDMLPPPAGATPGHIGWHELHAVDQEAAFAFYADLFGWTKREALDLGPAGLYQAFATGALPDSPMAGGMMTQAAANAAATWIHYINVGNVATAAARTKEAGGQVLVGPRQVPSGSWIAECLDSQGASFAVIGPDR